MRRRNIIGLCGYAKSGKDTICAALQALDEQRAWTRVAFADALKADLYRLVSEIDPDVDFSDPDTKAVLRPLFVAYGDSMRVLNPAIWIMRALPHLSTTRDVVVTDVRYLNECNVIRAWGGKIIYIERDGVRPANATEAASLAVILDARAFDLRLVNNNTPREAATALLSYLSAVTNEKATA